MTVSFSIIDSNNSSFEILISSKVSKLLRLIVRIFCLTLRSPVSGFLQFNNYQKAVMNKLKTVDEFILKRADKKPILQKLREILLSAGLHEEIKWGVPTYTFRGKNIVGISSFKSYTGLWFFQGALLKDPDNLLVNAQEGVTKAQRQMRFYKDDVINENVIREYVAETLENHKKGLVIKPEKNKVLVIPDELTAVFKDREEIENSFNELSLTKRREYAEYIESAKRPETRLKRIEKILPMISDKIGLNDKYR